LLEAKRRYSERCRKKKRQKRERVEKEIKEIKTEKEVWKYINRERKKKESMSEEITLQEWEEYLMKLLEGRKEKGKAEAQMKVSTNRCHLCFSFKFILRHFWEMLNPCLCLLWRFEKNPG
jgi:hypothetical protein